MQPLQFFWDSCCWGPALIETVVFRTVFDFVTVILAARWTNNNDDYRRPIPSCFAFFLNTQGLHDIFFLFPMILSLFGLKKRTSLKLVYMCMAYFIFSHEPLLLHVKMILSRSILLKNFFCKRSIHSSFIRAAFFPY